MKLLLALVGFLGLCASAHAQISSQLDLDNLASGLDVTWDVVTNTKEAERYQVEITLTNSATSGVNLANDNWQLHLYSIFMIEPDMMGPYGHVTITLPGQHVSVTHVHGSHFYISPTREFATIPPGESRKIKFKVRYWSVARTDTMPHWYITYGTFQPRIIASTAAESLRFVADRTRVEQLKRYDFDTYLPFTPQDRYERYRMTEDRSSDALLRLVPKPVRVTESGRGTVTLDPTWVISCPSTLANEADYLSETLTISPTIIYDGSPQSSISNGANVIRLETGQVPFTRDEANHVIEDSGDAYSLAVNVDTQRINIIGRAASGVFYGAVSLVSLTGGTNNVPAYSISDAPRFEYRGFMLDIARNFHNEQELATLIEAMALYKLNKLHLHVTDDEGWRLEIRPLPELTRIGATQCHDMQETTCLLTEIGSFPHGNAKFLTAAQYSAILDLANRRHVTVIPEIDMPGHARAAIKSMEVRMSSFPTGQDLRLTEPGDQSKYLSNQMFSDNALNPCLGSAWSFINIVMDELIRLHSDAGHPLETFHFGGDEVARGAFDNSTACQSLRNGGQLPEGSVKAYFMQEVSKLANQKGLSVAAWEDGVMGPKDKPFDKSDNPASSITAYAWSDVWDWGMTSRTYNLANAGYKVVMAHATHLYFDHPCEPDPEERGYYWATRFTDTKKTFSYNAADVYKNIKELLTGEPIAPNKRCPTAKRCPVLTSPENIIGIQTTLFSETSRTEAQVHHQVFPRLLAFAERAWHQADWETMADGQELDTKLDSDWSRFAQTVSDREFDRLQKLDIHYRIPTPAARLQNGVLEVTSEFPDFAVLYSVDNAQTWDTVTPDLRIGSEVNKVMLRTSSKDKTRFSRTVTLITRPEDELSNTLQKTLDYIGKNLKVTVSVLDNYEEFGDNFFLGTIKLRNGGATDILPGSWKIYFATLKMPEPDTLLQGRAFIHSELNLVLEHIQGPLVSLGPTGNFRGLKAGAEITMRFKGDGSSVSADDFLPNWYVSAPGLNARDIVSTNNETSFVAPYTPEKAQVRSRNDKYTPWSPESRYGRNDAWNVDYNQSTVPGVIPSPVTFTLSPSGQVNLLQGTWAVVASDIVTDAFIEWMTKFLPGVTLTRQTTAPSDRSIVFQQGEIIGSSSLEAYSIRVTSATNRVGVTSRTDKGAFRAVMTIVQLALKSLPTKAKGILPNCQITDYPRFDFRGFYLDTARFFMPKESVFRVLDVMAVYKMNELHLHLSDDEGWRLEIPDLPELTQTGSTRCHDQDETDCLLDTLGSGPETLGQTDQFYTTAEFEEILRYAQARHIEVIPEFDMPGHSRASIRSMSARWQNLRDIGQPTVASHHLLHELGDPTQYVTPQYYTENVVNPCLQSTYTFLQTVYSAVNSMYRNVGLSGLPAFHLGGEDVPENAWQNASSCQSWLQEGRQFIIQASQQLSGATMAVWEDALFQGSNARTPIEKSQFPRSFVLSDVYQSVPEWGKMGRAYSLANAGYKVIMCPASHVFFDHPQEPDPVEGGNVWASRYIDTYRTFSFMPYRYYDNVNMKLSGEAISKDFFCQQDNSGCPALNSPENIQGMKGVMRTLTTKSQDEFDFQVYPRLLALAERAWHRASWEDVTDEGQRQRELAVDWARFASNLGSNDLKLLDLLGVKYRVPPPGVRSENDKLNTNVEFPGLSVQFRMTDNSGSDWMDLRSDIRFDDGKEVLLRTVSADGKRYSREVKVTTGKTTDGNNNNNNNNSSNNNKKNTGDGTQGLTGSRSTVLLIASMAVAMVTCIRHLIVL